MSNSFKNIVITPNRNQNGLPEIAFTGFGNTSMRMVAADGNVAKLDFVSSGSTVFSVDSNLSSGSLFSVSDQTNSTVLEVKPDKISLSSSGGKIICNGNEFNLPVYAYNSIPSSGRVGDVVFDESNNIPRFFNGNRWAPLGNQKSGMSPETAGDSALQILQDYPDSINGAYWINVNGEPIELYCDMGAIDGGGWTLIGKSRGTWHAPFIFLKQNWNIDQMNTNIPLRDQNTWASINSIDIAVNKATEICFANHSLTRWVRCPMHTGRTTSTLFAVEAGYSTINTSATNNSQTVTATAWNGVTQSVFVNPYMTMAFQSHGGSYPAWTLNTAGNTNVSEYAMACPVATTNHNGFTAGSSHNGQDAPYDQGDFGWPNPQYNAGGAFILIFVR